MIIMKYAPIIDDYIDGIEKTKIALDEMSRCSVSGAISFLEKARDEIDPKSPCKYNKILVSDNIILWFPGLKDNGMKHKGDYALAYNNKEIKHEEICELIAEDVCKNTKIREQRYGFWVNLLEDVYYNGLINIQNYKNNDQEFARLVFWITLQEDINKKEKLGRLNPFCRYAEALATLLDGSKYSMESVKHRCLSREPHLLDEWEISNCPSFYGWSAF